MAKEEGKPGRPKGADKVAMNIYIHSDRAKRLREFAADQQKNISVIIENALAGFYKL